ncbi:MAG: prolipoprotein diacylglyceryl transferase [Desulfarculaceae bacterium]|nr:prolipoprotein diacylglyceryl transferase [Desulfarculaceae bacterium]MCF8072526.1 prolipoprotein diacylglyceryl transferase [Desulfarculaceae bacterium]MCF8103667.1 prolipoprotein diacylglyceryl transferase [Desulfarculaceae bacterium]MCF8117067.1 prolipoprotein diacylglyceryl transferase [Desulfarculaceae bacterium]
MYPILFSIGPLTLHTYGVMLALGAALGMLLYTGLAKNAGLDPDRAMSLALWLLISGLIGSRLMFVILEPSQFMRAPWRVLAIWEGGLVFYGGVAGAAVVGIWLMRRWKLPVLTLMDCVAPALALAQAIGRIGCFSAGCCYGLPWEDGWCAVTFSDPHSLAPRNIALHPAQLYTTATLLVVCGLLLLLWRRRSFAGQIFFTYGFLHGVARVIIETFRGDWRGEPMLGLTPTAWFALGLAVFSAAALVYLRKRHADGKRN